MHALFARILPVRVDTALVRFGHSRIQTQYQHSRQQIIKKWTILAIRASDANKHNKTVVDQTFSSREVIRLMLEMRIELMNLTVRFNELCVRQSNRHGESEAQYNRHHDDIDLRAVAASAAAKGLPVNSYLRPYGWGRLFMTS